MSYQFYLAFVGFAFATSITPGPNNLMLLASGTNFGLRRSVPHMLGISIGFFVMLTAIGMGVGKIFEIFPILQFVFQVLAVGYMLFLAYKIATSAPKLEAGQSSTARPMTFLQAAAFQWVNPKAWAMSLSAISIYLSEGAGLLGVFLVAAGYSLVNLPSVTMWVLLGTQVRRLLRTPQKLRVFNWLMAVLLVVSLLPILR